MADGDEKPRKMKPETMGLVAIVLAVLGGGGGVGLNMSSNHEVASKLETLTLTMVEFKGAIKANDERSARLEVKVDKHDVLIDKIRDETLEKFKDELVRLKQEVKILEAKLK